MTVAYPKLRDDLVIRRQETPEGPCFVVKDPRNGAFFRLRQAEYAAARRLDGVTPLDGVAAGLGAELGVDATAAEVQPFVTELERRGLLESSRGGGRSRRRFVRGTILWLRVAAFDPDRLLAWLAPKVRFLFTSWFVAASALLIAWALLATWQDWSDIADDIAGLWRIESLFLLWLAVLSATALHELAHGLTCKHFGGEVREMGFLLIYFQPALYCNISDAYLFPERSRRLWVTAAGACCDLVLWGIATLLWRVLERSTWPSSCALIVMASAGIRTFFNLNPLIKLDGYYLLTDLLGIPNLRPRAFAYVGSLLKRLGGGAGAAAAPSPRERRIFLLYGVLAAGFSFWLITHLLLVFGRFLVSNYQGWGFVMITLLTVATFSRQLKALVPKVRLPRKRRVALLAAAALGGLLFVRLPLTVSGEFVLLPGKNADVRAEIEGVLAEICVDEGDEVAAGALIGRVADRSLRTRVAVVDAVIGEHEARLRQLRAGARPETLEVARVALRKADDRLAFGRHEAERMRSLAEDGLVTKEECDRAEQQAAILKREADEATARLKELEAGPRPEEIAAAEQQIAAARAERAELLDDIARAAVRTPHAGVVTTPRVREKVGEHVEPGDLIAEVHAVEAMTAEVKVSEKEIGDVRAGMPVTLRFRAFPDRTFTGVVAAPAPAAEEVAGSHAGRIVRVPIEVRNPDGILKPNLTGYARIDTGKRRASEIVTRRVRRFLRLEFWSWW